MFHSKGKSRKKDGVGRISGGTRKNGYKVHLKKYINKKKIYKLRHRQDFNGYQRERGLRRGK